MRVNGELGRLFVGVAGDRVSAGDADEDVEGVLQNHMSTVMTIRKHVRMRCTLTSPETPHHPRNRGIVLGSSMACPGQPGTQPRTVRLDGNMMNGTRTLPLSDLWEPVHHLHPRNTLLA